jgi:hypothetical protein
MQWCKTQVGHPHGLAASASATANLDQLTSAVDKPLHAEAAATAPPEAPASFVLLLMTPTCFRMAA